MDRLSILIVSFNTVEHLRRCLQSLRDNPPAINWEVIVLDNASSDGSVEMISQEFPECRLIRSEVNLGYGAGMNLAVQEAQGSYLLLLNPDIEVSRGSLDAVLAFARSHPRAGVVGPRLLESDGRTQPSTARCISVAGLLFEMLRLHRLLPGRARERFMLGGYFSHAESVQVPCVIGACHLIPRKVWDEVGPLTEETFFGFDDYDYCHRTREQGYEVWFCAEATLTHHRSISATKRWSTWQSDQVYLHNRYLMLSRYWPRWRVKLYGVVEILQYSLEGLYHVVRRRRGVENYTHAYGDLLRRRVGLIWRFVTGREHPIRRFQPEASRT
jgi:GT2 family glycosyltransferase